MAIQYNENIKIAAPAPLDKRYLSTRTLGGAQLPYSACTEVNTTIISSERYTGLTVNIGGIEYWYKDGVLDTCLIEKKYDTNIPQYEYMTGATNLGFFSGYTGVQRLQLVGFGAPPLDGCYFSEYNNYYIDSTSTVRLGEYPHRGYERRAYVNAPRTASWIYNVPTGSWVITPNDVVVSVGCSVGCLYASVYPNSSWSGYVTSGGTSVTATGSLTTGGTCVYGAPIYGCIECQDIHIRTLVSCTPTNIKLGYDDNFIYFSGTSAILTGENVGIGSQIFKQKTGTTLQFRTLIPSGDTTFIQRDNDIIVFSSSDGSGIAITGGTNIGSGAPIYSGVADRNACFRTLVGSGNTSVSQIGDEVVIYTSGGSETYNLSSPAAICVGGINIGTVLTGKTAFELFEELLVPELCGSVTAPSISIGLTCSGIKEIGTVISQTVTGTFSRGSINPQYCSLSPYRSGEVNAYCFVGEDMPSGWQACTTSPATQTDASYTVVSGTQTWSVCAQYDAGLPALGSKGTEYCAALPSGSTALANATITGILPWYWGVSASGVITGSDVANGNKTVAVVGASTPITFNAVTQFLWFAAPTGTYTTKTKWWVCAANAGNIGGTGELWAAACNVSVNSIDGCWSGCSFDVYVTCGITTTATGVPMCLYY